jgi:hypothetical protein
MPTTRSPKICCPKLKRAARRRPSFLVEESHEALEDVMRKSILIATILSLALAGPVLAQGPKAAEKQPAPAPQSMKMMITGKIAKVEQGYVIQGQKPLELFTILNANPKVLDKLVKSGKTVTIEAVSVVGDNVNIQKIDGKDYQEPEAGKPKRK